MTHCSLELQWRLKVLSIPEVHVIEPGRTHFIKRKSVFFLAKFELDVRVVRRYDQFHRARFFDFFSVVPIALRHFLQLFSSAFEAVNRLL